MSYHWIERCMICGEVFHNLVAAQEHVMDVHGYTQDDIRKNTKRSDGEGFIFTMPDGRDWMHATREHSI